VTDFALPETTGVDQAVGGGAGQRRGIRGSLASLFPESPEPALRSAARRWLIVIGQLAAVAAGAALLLERIPGLPPWDTIYGEDYWEFFTQALEHPWHVFIPYNSYEQLVPRVLAQFAMYLPLGDVAAFFAIIGAVIATCCALFIFHASAGHIRSVWLRALLGAAVVLLPVAPLEIADSGVNTPWYLLLAIFWALLWRPRTRTGIALAALVAFAAASSNSLCFLFAPLVAIRLYVLRRPRDHAVSMGWLAGCVAQVPEILWSYTTDHSRLTQKPASLGASLTFYAHETLLPSLGWHLAWRLQSLTGKDGATLIVSIVLLAVLGTIVFTQPRNRAFVVLAVLTGLVFCVFGTTITARLTVRLVQPDYELGSRYTVLPIFLLECAAVLGVDYVLRRRRTDGRHRRTPSLRPVAAAAALVIVLAASWGFDFRYAGLRSDAVWNWGKESATWERACQHSRTGVIVEKTGAFYEWLPCANMRK
jgi:hypothetical protein